MLPAFDRRSAAESRTRRRTPARRRCRCRALEVVAGPAPHEEVRDAVGAAPRQHRLRVADPRPGDPQLGAVLQDLDARGRLVQRRQLRLEIAGQWRERKIGLAHDRGQVLPHPRQVVLGPAQLDLRPLGLDLHLEHVGPIGLADVVELLRDLHRLAGDAGEIAPHLHRSPGAQRLVVQELDGVQHGLALHRLLGLGVDLLLGHGRLQELALVAGDDGLLRPQEVLRLARRARLDVLRRNPTIGFG